MFSEVCIQIDPWWIENLRLFLNPIFPWKENTVSAATPDSTTTTATTSPYLREITGSVDTWDSTTTDTTENTDITDITPEVIIIDHGLDTIMEESEQDHYLTLDNNKQVVP